ncbi:hypothetical protein KR222_002256, partial [Zaprionus bogoriensis]
QFSHAMEGQLLSAARPYLRFFSLLTLGPPPGSYYGSRRWQLLNAAFSCYACCVFLLTIYVTYVNIKILDEEVTDLQVEDFTNALGQVQKVAYSLIIFTVHANMWLKYQSLGHIYSEIYALELDIDVTAQRFGTQQQRHSFRYRLAKIIAVWILGIFIFFPPSTVHTLGEMIWHDKILTEFVMLVLHFKCVEYTLYVVLVQELLLRLRRTLLKLQQELSACEQGILLQALCQGLRQNKRLLARIWRLVGELESYFLLPLLLVFLFNGLSTLHVVNWAYIRAGKTDDEISLRVGNFIFLILNLLIPCWIGHNCINTYNSFKRILHDIRCGSQQATPQILNMVLMEYGLQLEHLKLRFTCGGFFNIDLIYFGGMLVTIVSYTIILIQFKLQAVLETKHRASQQSNS